ncbi:PHD finger protein rhinoceros [Culicoides brevitarsis]|uniref:PHD finger protein rhinoceros n=1 Tax=Culicoides brevitarsis TaxID=469753 RepID=UPI00307C92F6
MSQKGKRPSQQRPENDGDPPVKRRKGRPPGSTNKDHSKNAASSSASAAALADHNNSSDNGLSSSHAAAAIASTSKSWQPKPHNDLKSIYNRSAPEAPAELFRKDLISAMKLPDSEPLSHDEYWLIVDQWKQEWERGVQVPVNPDALPQATVNNIRENYIQRGRQDFKLPKNKYIRITKDESFSHEQHYLSHTPAMAESVCAYDLDQCDEAWLKICNGERALSGLSPISDTQFERVVEELEVRCWDKIHSILKNEEGFGIEYDENVICDVCRSPDSEEANEMVFCDNCNICVHQACYGITAIPSGQWLCRTCTTGIKPDCVLCPNKGGAMKSTKSGTKWAHVSCALWIPEVSIGSVDRMEPITKISNIPQSRWALNCILCREKVGACIQCSVKTCKTAYHVTCAFQHGLEMRAIIEDEHNEDGVKLRSYCQKHSTTKTKKDGKTTSSSNSNKTSTNASATGSGTEGEDGDGNKRRRTRKEMTTEERNQVRAARLAEIESEFHKHVNIKDISCHLLDIDQEGINYIYNYWILKRKSGNNRPLLPPKNEDAELASQKEENQEQEKMRMFVQLRQDLERVRNLCYMVSRREKLSRSFFKLREQTFHKQVGILADLRHNSSSNSSKKLLDDSVVNAVIEANHGPSIYDKLYSSDSVSNIHSNHSSSEVANNIDVMIDRLMNITSSSSRSHKSPRQATSSIDLGSNSSLDKINLSPHKSRQSVDINGINNNNKKNLSSSKSSSNNTSDNLFKRATYVNGTTTSRRSASLYSSTGFSSDSDRSRTRRTLRGGANLSAASSSDENDEENRARRRQSAATPIVTSPKSASGKAITARRRSQNTKTLERKRRRDAKQESTGKYKSNALVDTSSDDETNNQRFNNARSPRNRTLQQMEKELHDERSHLSDSTDSDELTGICYKPTSYSHTTKVSNAIYSDSDSTDKDKTDNTASDSQQHPFRTKAAMKEFNLNAVSSASALTTGTTTTTTTSPLAKTKQPPKGILKNAGEKSSVLVTNLDHNKEKSSKSRSEKSASKKDFPADLLVVPQRQAAKKASENLMRTNPVVQQVSTFNKKDSSKNSDVETNYDSKLSRVSSVDEMSDRKSQKSKKTLQRQESNSSDRESSKKDSKTTSSSKKENSFIEALPYVPQRQAAKKAAEHIKSTVLKPSETAVVAPAAAAPEPEVKTPTKRTSSSKTKDEKNDASDSSSSESDSSSSSGSSSGSGSKSSSSSSDDSEPSPAPPAKVTQKRQSTSNQKAASVISSRRTSDKAKDLPFLDKGNKSAGTVFCSSESDSDSKSSSDASVESQKRTVPAKITKRKSSSAVSHKSTSSGVGTSTGTNASSSNTGRPRGRPRTKSVFKENESSSQGSVKEPEIKTPTKTKDEPARRLSTTTTPSSTNTTPAKSTTRGRRDSKVQISENATTPSSRRRTSDVSTSETTSPAVDAKPRRHSTRRDSLTSPLKDKISAASESRVTDKKDLEDTDDTKTTRKRKLSTTITQPEDEEKSKPEKSEKSPERELPTTKTDETNDKTGIVTPTKRESDPIVNELPSTEAIIDKVKTPVKELENSSRPESRLSNPTPEKHKSPVKKPTRTSSDMEIDPMNSPPYIAQLTSQKIPEPSTKISDISKNNGPKSIFDLNDDLADTTEPHFEVPPTPLAFTSHHNDWLKVDANEDTQQATMDLVQKLRQNKQKKQNPDAMLSEQDLNQKTDLSALELDIKKPEDSLLDLNKPENDDVFDRPLDKLNPCRLAGLNATQDTIMSQQKQQLLGNQATNCMGSPNFNQDSFMYGRRWNEAEIIARRRSVSSSPASTVSDNTELQQQQQLHQNQQNPMNDNKNQAQMHQNIPCSQLPTNQNMQQMPQMMPSKPFDNQVSQQQQQQQPMLSQDQIPLQMQNQNQMPHGQQPMVTFPPFNQMQMPQQHRPLKPECMFFNQQQQQGQKPLGASPTYQMGPRGMFPNAASRMPNKDMNIQNYRQTNPMFMNSNANILENNLLPMGSPNAQPQPDLKIKSSPHSNKNAMMQPDMNLQQQQNLLPPQQIPQVTQQTPAIPDRKSSVQQSTVSLADIKKSPAKTAPKLSVRNTYQQNIENMQNQVRSPHLNTKMSPGKSPRQMDMINKQANEKRGKGSTTMGEPPAVKGRQKSNSTKNSGQSNRGRNSGGGNKKGRTKPLPFNDFDFGGTNHSNLAGTAYDLDLVEEENYKLENFRTSLLRDRKKSNDTSSMDYLKSREPSQSPKFSSPKNRSVYSSAANTPTAGTTPSGNTPLHQQGHHPLMTPEVNNTSTHSMTPNSNVSTSLHDMVLPVLPGPVDMRTYSSFDSSANNELFNNHLLGAFDSGTADHTMAEIDEEMEKELQSALKASNSKAKETPVSTTITTTESTTVTNATNSITTVVTTNKTTTVTAIVPEPVEEASVDSDTMKVSFSDSRNQLKLKIKGPLAPDGYSSSSFVQKTVEQSISQAPAPASSGLRRMRKKELLRQYWNQDANLDDQTSSSMGDTNPSVPTYSLPNRVSGIPKAVDSMSCIPTKEDYKDYAVVDTKKRKKVSGLQRELRQLTGVVEDETVERRRSIGAGSDKSSNASTSGRGRLNRSGPAVGQTLKMKIKIGMNYIEPATEEVRQSDRPPKKRHENMVNYSLEDLRRDSLNFRKQVYADYDKKDKVKEKGSDKEKKKKKKDKKRKVEVIENNQKFVLKIKKPKLDENPSTESVLKPEAPANAFDPNAKDPLSTPSASETVPKLKLKLSRTSGTTDSYTLASKEKTPAKKQNKKQTSTSKTNNQKGTKKESAPIKKRELTECRLQLEKLDQDTIKKFVSKTNPSNSPLTAGGSDVVNDNDAAKADKTPVDSHLGAANEINSNSNLNIRSSSNNNTNLSESCNSKKDEPVNMQKNSEQDTVQNSGDAIKPPADQSKDCEVR